MRAPTARCVPAPHSGNSETQDAALVEARFYRGFWKEVEHAELGEEVEQFCVGAAVPPYRWIGGPRRDQRFESGFLQQRVIDEPWSPPRAAPPPADFMASDMVDVRSIMASISVSGMKRLASKASR